MALKVVGVVRLVGSALVVAIMTAFLSQAQGSPVEPGESNLAPYLATGSPARKVTKVTLWYRNFDSPAVRQLVTLALDKTPEYGPYLLTRSMEMGQGRVVRELTRAEPSPLVDMANIAASIERENRLVAIPIPIDGGLLGLRICVVRSQDMARFKEVKTVADFARLELTIGQGTHWPDTQVLRANGVEVITDARFETLFRMLRNERFSCFARGINEVLHDLEALGSEDLSIEPDLLLAYPMPSYFFFADHQHELAHRVQLGMERAIVDGSFAGYLRTHYLEAVTSLRLENRRVLVLENPYLTEDSAAIWRRALSTLRSRIELAHPVR
ncbi:hypothetical protein [Marinobacter salicampi]|uniref:hypothetical protein n=1 Tax=Marinobacter salicampi TaxID=435907 RepID=UPI001F5EBD04|nr:hypothetical protein [Marinobacter salicampi]